MHQRCHTPFFAVAKALCNTTVLKGENMFLQRVFNCLICLAISNYHTINLWYIKQLWLDCTINYVSMISIDQPSFHVVLMCPSQGLKISCSTRVAPACPVPSWSLDLPSWPWDESKLEIEEKPEKTSSSRKWVLPSQQKDPNMRFCVCFCHFLPMSMWCWRMV